MKIIVGSTFTPEQANLVRNAKSNASLVGKTIGVPAPFNTTKGLPNVPKEVFELILIPFDSLDINKRGLLKYGKKYKPPYIFEPLSLLFDNGQVYMSAPDEHGFGKIVAEVEFIQKPKVFLIHIGICNQKFVIVMVHKDHIAPENVSANLSLWWETPENHFPYPVNADWHGLPGSWEHHEAKRSGKPLTEPNLINSMPCKISIEDNEDYVSVAFLHDYHGKARDIITVPHSPISTIAQSIGVEFNVHDMIANFLVTCRSNNIFESGYIASSGKPLSFQPLKPSDVSAVYKGDTKKKKDTTKPVANKELEAKINRLEDENKSQRKSLDELKNINTALSNCITNTIGDSARVEKEIETLSNKYNNGYGSAELMRYAIERINFIWRNINSLEEKEKQFLMSSCPDFIRLVFHDDIKNVSVIGFDGEMFIIKIDKKGQEPIYSKLYQLVNLNSMKDWLDVAVQKIAVFYDSEGERKGLKDKIEYLEIFIGFLNAMFKHQADCMRGAISRDKIFALEED